MMLKQMGYEAVVTVRSLSAAQQQVKQRRPDLVISDIFMPDEQDGITFARELLTDQIPVILITSSKDQRVYENARATLPVAYLVKPFDQLSLQAAIERTFIQRGHPVFITQILQKWHQQRLVREHIFVRRSSALIKIAVKDIDYVEADGNYCYLYESQKKFAVKSSLKAIKSLLASGPFLQVNRSNLVNFHRIREISFSDGVVRLGDRELTIGNAYRAEIDAWMNRL